MRIALQPLAAALGLLVAGPLAAQITVVKPLGTVPPRRHGYTPPRLIFCPEAQYPDSLKRLGLGGRVKLEVVVDSLGHVPPGRIVVRESPHPDLTRAAVVMAVQCRFQPGRVEQQAVEAYATIPVEFRVRRAHP